MNSEEKILTVAVPTYNMEACLSENLASYLSFGTENNLSVIVLDNSSEDKSFEIAKQYEEKYPQLFKVFKKENRGYGSSVNFGIDICKTKYFRVVDADDSVNPFELAKFIEHLKTCDADVVETPYSEVDGKTGEERLVKLKTEFGKLLPAKAVKNQSPPPSLHSSTFRTSLLQENGIRLLENAYFADEELALYPFFYAKNIIAFDDRVYRYTVNNKNQSTSPENRIKYLSQRAAVIKRMLENYKGAKIREENREFAKERIALSAGNHLTTLYILHPKRCEGRRLAAEFSAFLKKNYPEIYGAVRKKKALLGVLNFFKVSPKLYSKLKKFLRFGGYFRERN